MTDIIKPVPKIRKISISGRYRLASRHIAQAASKSPQRMGDGLLYLNAVLMLALGECVQDELKIAYGLPGYEGKFKAEQSEIKESFNHQRKRLKMDVSEEDYAKFEGIVKEVKDNCWRSVQCLNATIKTELTQKVSYEKVAVGAMLGIAHSLTYACNQLYKKVTGRNCNEYEKIMEAIERMDGKVGFSLLNPGKLPDQQLCADAIVRLIQDMEKSTMEILCAPSKKGGEQ